MTDKAIEISDLRCRWGDHLAVDGVDLEVGRGEVVALLGPNGAGKTTLMETLEGHRAADEGRVSVLGLDPATERTSLRPRVGIMLQEGGFTGELTVAETVGLWAGMSTRSSDPEAVIERVDLKHKADVRVAVLSGGEKRRLDLALAILGDPEVLFLDEPTTGLDPDSRRRTWEVVKELREQGTAILLTTHYLEEAEALADRVTIIEAGSVVASGTVSELATAVDATISFEADGDVVGRLPRLAGRVLPDASGGGVAISTPQLQDDLHALLCWADENGVRLRGLRARDGSLDDVFEEVLA